MTLRTPPPPAHAIIPTDLPVGGQSRIAGKTDVIVSPFPIHDEPALALVAVQSVVLGRNADPTEIASRREGEGTERVEHVVFLNTS